MVAAANMVEVAALVGDTARATMLAALMGGQALTGTELAFLARISRPTASEHLFKLSSARLISVVAQGRYRYYQITSPYVAQMLESIITVAALDVPARHRPRSANDDALRFARTCYDHLAGHLGVAIADALIAKGDIQLSHDAGIVTNSGHRFFADFGVNLIVEPGRKRIFCRACLDWSERRYHVAGTVGSGIQCRLLELGWVQRNRDSRALRITSDGYAGLKDIFNISLLPSNQLRADIGSRKANAAQS